MICEYIKMVGIKRISEQTSFGLVRQMDLGSVKSCYCPRG